VTTGAQVSIQPAQHFLPLPPAHGLGARERGVTRSDAITPNT